MWLKHTTDILRIINRPMVNILKSIAMVTLAIMMFLTAADVFLRYLINRPISGAYEIIEYLMAILVSFSVVYCAYEKAHISVDVFISPLSKRIRVILSAITVFLAFLFFLFMTLQAFINIGDEYRSGITSAVLLIPAFPFVGTLAVAFGLLCLVLLADFLSLLRDIGNKWTQ